MDVRLPGDFAAICYALVTHALEPMTVIDQHGAIGFENEATGRQTGYRVDERIGRPIFDFVHEEDGRTYARRSIAPGPPSCPRRFSIFACGIAMGDGCRSSRLCGSSTVMSERSTA